MFIIVFSDCVIKNANQQFEIHMTATKGFQ